MKIIFAKKILIVFLLMFFSSKIFAQQDAGDVFMFCYFKNQGKDGLHLAYSNDGYKWKALNNDSSFLKPTAGVDKLMRDPCIIKGPDGIFRMVWTVSWKERNIGYASSTDLIHWSEQKDIPVMADELLAQNAWAPEIIYNDRKKNYMIYWATTIKGKFPATDTLGDNDHRIYYVTTKDFITFTKAKLLYEHGFNVIDATIQKVGRKKYVMFLKDETLKPPHKNLHTATSKHLTKGWSDPSPSITGNYWAEGPTAVKIGDEWVVYFDKYRDHKYGAVASKDLEHWSEVPDKISLPSGIRHGTIFKITREVFEKLMAK